MNTPLRRPRAIALAVPADPVPLATALGAAAALATALLASIFAALWR
jgi:hypothetical protein